jgi:hypothetical protein
LALKKKLPGDAHQVEWRLTPQGQALLVGQGPSIQARLLTALSQLGTLERRGLKSGLQELWDGMVPAADEEVQENQQEI